MLRVLQNAGEDMPKCGGEGLSDGAGGESGNATPRSVFKERKSWANRTVISAETKALKTIFNCQ